MNLASLSSPGHGVLHLVLELQDFLHFLQFAICDFRIWIEPRRFELAGLSWSVQEMLRVSEKQVLTP